MKNEQVNNLYVYYLFFSEINGNTNNNLLIKLIKTAVKVVKNFKANKKTEDKEISASELEANLRKDLELIDNK